MIKSDIMELIKDIYIVEHFGKDGDKNDTPIECAVVFKKDLEQYHQPYNVHSVFDIYDKKIAELIMERDRLEIINDSNIEVIGEYRRKQIELEQEIAQLKQTVKEYVEYNKPSVRDITNVLFDKFKYKFPITEVAVVIHKYLTEK